MEYNDAIGRPLRVGDKVVHASSWNNSIHFSTAEIIDIIEGKAKPIHLLYDEKTYRGEDKTLKVYTKNLIRLY